MTTTTNNVAVSDVDGTTVTALQAGNDSVKDLGNGDNMQGALAFDGTGSEAAGYDVGIGFGTAGIGKDDVRDVSFTFGGINSVGLTLDDFIGMDFGIRMTSVGTEGGSREGSVKLTSLSFAPVNDGNKSFDCATENTARAGEQRRQRRHSLRTRPRPTAATVTVQQTITQFSLDGGDHLARRRRHRRNPQLGRRNDYRQCRRQLRGGRLGVGHAGRG